MKTSGKMLLKKSGQGDRFSAPCLQLEGLACKMHVNWSSRHLSLPFLFLVMRLPATGHKEIFLHHLFKL
jgi:hypothetical protein